MSADRKLKKDGQNSAGRDFSPRFLRLRSSIEAPGSLPLQWITCFEKVRHPSGSKPPVEVWHALKLTNSGKLPWASAPAQAVKDDRLLGQDILPYTPAGGETLLRITRAMSVKADQTELETDRQRDAVQMYGYSFDRVTVQGRLQVTNHKSEPITLEITKHVSGEVRSSSPQAEVEQLAKGLRRMNPSQLLTWSLSIKPAEKLVLAYTYEALIRR